MLYSLSYKTKGSGLEDKDNSGKLEDMHAQASMEYMVIYGWAILIMAIIIGILYFYTNVPAQIVTNSCYFINGVYCNEIVFAANTITHNTIIAFSLTNSQQYALANVTTIARVNNANTTKYSCYPSFVPPGGYIGCAANLTVNATLGTLLSGNLYVSATYCGPSQNCSGSTSQNQIYKGSFTGHTQRIAPANVMFTTTTLPCSSSGNIVTINGNPYTCNSLVNRHFTYNIGTLLSYSFISNILVSTGEQEAYPSLLINNIPLSSNSANIVVAGNIKFSFNYNIQYELTESYGGNGNPPTLQPGIGNHWYNISSFVTISAPLTYKNGHINWACTGAGCSNGYTGASPTATILIGNSMTETATYH